MRENSTSSKEMQINELSIDKINGILNISPKHKTDKTSNPPVYTGMSRNHDSINEVDEKTSN